MSSFAIDQDSSLLSSESPNLPSLSSEIFDPAKQSKLPVIRWIAIVETLVFLTLAVGFNYFFGHGTRFIGVSPHPFWAIILLITVQYGPGEAVVAALLSSAFLLVGNLPEQSLSETIYEYILHVTFTPFVWVVTALVLGSIRARQLNEKKNLSDRLEVSEEASTAIVHRYNAIKKSKEQLEVRLAEERCSMLMAFEVAKSLETLDPEEALAGIEKLVKTAFHATKFSLYLWDGNVLRLDSAYGWAEENEFLHEFGTQDSLAISMLQNKHLSVAHGDDDLILDGEGVMAGPLFDEESRRSLGMLKIEDAPFMDMGVRSHESFRIVCQWVSRVCANVKKYQAALAKNPQIAAAAKDEPLPVMHPASIKFLHDKPSELFQKAV